jgi:hypothetical protein
MGDHISDDELSVLTTTSLTEQELDDTAGRRIFVGVPTGAMTAMMCWGPGVGLLVWATAGGHGFVAGN